MSQRNSNYERRPLDQYDTPPSVTDALLTKLRDDARLNVVWEPACGAGLMCSAIVGAGHQVIATDILPRTPLGRQVDFFSTTDAPLECRAIVTNPPFGDVGQKFAEHALALMKPRDGLVALLFRCDYDHANSRRHLFADHPAFARRIILTKRIVWFVEENGKPKASPSYNHMWVVWDWKHRGPPIVEYAP